MAGDVGCRWCALVEADISRLKRVTGGSLRSATDRPRSTEAGIAGGALNGRLELGRPTVVRLA